MKPVIVPEHMPSQFEISLVQSIQDIEPSAWSKVVNTDYPFIQYDFILALEKSGATSIESGWQPSHLIIRQQDQIRALMPLYIKNHSYGEYVFDFQWANAYRQSGMEYYPKLVTAIPYTPSSGSRIYLNELAGDEASGDDSSNIGGAISQAFCKQINEVIKRFLIEQNISSWHVLFPTKAESQLLQNSGTLRRLGMQYHWFNQQYTSFDDFLNRCKSKQRKNIKRERRQVAGQGIEVKVIPGSDITPELWDKFFLFYQLTYIKRSGHSGYLNKEFFSFIGESLSHAIIMVVAMIDNEVIAASLFFKDSSTLYGRYWGCMQEYDFLHFELCYYQGIEYCISHQLQKFDAGAQGEHKIQRGFTPTKTYSNHWIANKAFAGAIQDFVEREALLVAESIDSLSKKLPYK